MVDLGRDKKASPARADVPFPAVVGQSELKEALLAVAANDALDGLLIRGEKGTAKSTAVRALADLLPAQAAVADCPYGCPPADPDSQCASCRGRDDPSVERRPVPLVTLPLGATRERVVGTLSVEKALDGDPEFEPGLLARANRGILYVDEVNLLDDHLVDVLLDAAASGVNRVERDGVSVTHPAEFTLIGTMNPEEGDLRPQLRDRFALQATVAGCRDVDDRVAIIDRALDRDAAARSGGDGAGNAHSRTGASAADPVADAATGDASIRASGDCAADPSLPGDEWRAGFAAATAERRDQLREARERVGEVTLPDEFAAEIAELCRDAGVDGHRGDIATARTALALAALDGRPKVLESDVRRAAELALPHRLQSTPFEDAPDPEDVIDDHFEDADADGEDGEGSGDRGDASDGENSGDGTDAETGDDEDDAGPEQVDDGDDDPEQSGDDGSREESGRPDDAADGESPGGRSPSRPDAAGGDGGDGGTEGERTGEDADAPGESDEKRDGTPLVPGQARTGVGRARAPDIEGPDAPDEAGPGGGSRSGACPSADNRGARVRTERTDSGGSVDAAASVRVAATRGSTAVESRDLRRSVRAGDAAALVVFAVDASASMRGPMRTAKGVAIELLRDAYEQRDEVALVAFAGDDADVLLPPTDSVALAARHLKDLPTGDRTPLPAGIRTAGEVIERADPDVGIVVLVTDGRANAADGSPTAETHAAAQRLADRGTHVVVVDAGRQDDRGLATEVAALTTGEHVPLSALSPERVETAVARARSEQR
ncbi:magnesium chelatase [Halobacteriales archaeon QS_1_68_17]|nr:MAG: magnesium chelatase [Halobacteriales archaeon QS_1_68_17]